MFYVFSEPIYVHHRQAIFMKHDVRVALVQMACTEDPVANQRKAEAHIRQAAADGAQIVCLQELYQSTYFCQYYRQEFFDLAEPIPGPATTALSSLAGQLGVVIIASLFEKRADGLYHNTAAVFDADGTGLGIYRKAHIPDDPLFYEKYYFTPGDTGYKVFNTRFARIGVLICWDQWYPEAARLTALKGAQILFYPTAIGMLSSETTQERVEFSQAWQTIQRSHAIANGCYVASVNRVGTEGELTFWGESFVCGPFGQMLAQAEEQETVLHASLDLSAIDQQRRTWPYLRDRRIDTYTDLTKRYLD